MNKLPASTGWLWIKQGFALFRKQPGGLSTLFLGYMFVMIFLSLLPVIGQLVPLMLVPVFSIAFMRACVDIEQNKRITPMLLISGFRKPAFTPLFALGTLYLAAAAAAVTVSTLADDGILAKFLMGRIELDAQVMKDANLSGAFMLALAVYVPAAMAFCFAAPLIYWQQMALGKALFFSFFAVVRALPAFITFALGWFGIVMSVSVIVVLIFGASELATSLMVPVSVVLTVVIYCSLYASYRQIFGAPQQPETEPPQ